jgi:hypothetical protein
MTAVGDVKNYSKALRTTCLLTGATAANSPPALVTDGVPMFPNESIYGSDTGVSFATVPTHEGAIVIKGVASGGTIAATFRLWGYHDDLAEWVPLGTGADTTKGTLNAGAAMGATKTNKILHAEAVVLVGNFTRLYLELIGPAGTTATFDAWIVVPRRVAY